MKSLLSTSILAVLLATAASGTISYTFSTSASYATGGAGSVDTTTTINGCNIGPNLCVDWSAGTDGTDPLAVQLVYTPFSDSETGTTLPEYFGNIQLFCIDTAANAGAGSLDSNCSDATLDGHLTINVNQTVPDTETGAFIGALSGGATGGGGVLIFFPSSFNLDGGDLTFQLQPTIFSTGGLGGIPQGESSSGGVTTIQGRVTDNSTSTPEPASSAFVAIGLLSLCFAARRNLA